MKSSWVLAAAVLVSCGPAEKRKSDDPTVVALDLDSPVDLTLTPRGPYWTTQPQSSTIGGSGRPSMLQFLPLDGGDVQDVLSRLNSASALTNDGTHLYWFDLESDGKPRLNRMDFDAEERTTLIDFSTTPEPSPSPDTQLIPFRGRLYWGGATHVWAMSLDGGMPQKLVRARNVAFARFRVTHVDDTGVYFYEGNQTLGSDFKQVGLEGQGFEPEPPDAGAMDAGVTDAGATDAGVTDAGTMDGGSTGDGGTGWPEEAPGVRLLRRGIVWSGAIGVAIRGPYIYWFNGALLGGTLVRAPLLGGEDDEVLSLPSNTEPTALASDGQELVFLLSSNVGGSVNRVEKNNRQELHQLSFLSGGRPRVLRLDATSAWFFAGGGRSGTLHRVNRFPSDAGSGDAGIDGGADAGIDGGP
jgi:hypothetical protein